MRNHLILGAVVISLVFLLSFSLTQRNKHVLGVSVTKDLFNQEIITWSNFIKAHPGYRDGYLKLAILKFNAGEIEEAKELITKVLTIDPNFVFPLTFPPELVPPLR